MLDEHSSVRVYPAGNACNDPGENNRVTKQPLHFPLLDLLVCAEQRNPQSFFWKQSHLNICRTCDSLVLHQKYIAAGHWLEDSHSGFSGDRIKKLYTKLLITFFPVFIFFSFHERRTLRAINVFEWALALKWFKYLSVSVFNCFFLESLDKFSKLF